MKIVLPQIVPLIYPYLIATFFSKNSIIVQLKSNNTTLNTPYLSLKLNISTIIEIKLNDIIFDNLNLH